MMMPREPPQAYAPQPWVPNRASYVPPTNWMMRAGGPSWTPLPVAGMVPMQALQTAPVLLLNTQGHLRGHSSYVPPPSRMTMARSPPPPQQRGAQNNRPQSPRRD